MEIILTSHAKERMSRRRLRLADIEATLSQPDKTIPQEDKLNFKFIKNINGRNYQVIGHYNDQQKKWIIVSAWVRGEEDPPDYLWIILTSPFRLLWLILKSLGKLIVFLAKKIGGKARKH